MASAIHLLTPIVLPKPKPRKGDGLRAMGASHTDRARVPDRLWVVADGLPLRKASREAEHAIYSPQSDIPGPSAETAIGQVALISDLDMRRLMGFVPRFIGEDER